MAQPLAAAPPRPADTGFEARFEALCRRHERLWLQAPETLPLGGPPSSSWRRWRSSRATRELIDRLAAEIRDYPDEPGARPAWRERMRETVSRFGEQRLGWPAGYRELLFADAFFEVTAEFARAARRLDPELPPAELGQALRNVWIMNSIQMLLDHQVRFTPAIFAYSMLYPATDNLLDDPQLPSAAKRRFNRRLRRRLAGERPAAAGAAERRVWELLDLIAGQYPRREFPEVWSSLMAIHRGQEASLGQQTRRPGDRELLAISVAKGGASVLADGYLTAGELASEEAEFCFGYGVFLQLLDDLQDARDDRAAGHRTLFSTARPPMDRLAARLWHAMDRIVDGSPRFAARRYAARRDLILRNCRSLLVGAVADAPELFSRRFRRHLERRWPLGFRAMRRLRRHGERRLRQAAEHLRARRGVESLFDLL